MSALGVTPARVLRSEWIRLSTLRSTKITFAAAVALMIGVAVLMSWNLGKDFETMTAADPADFAVEEVVLLGRVLAELAVGVIGVMAITGEDATGMIRATLSGALRAVWSRPCSRCASLVP